MLETTAKGDVERRLHTMTTILVSMTVERFVLRKKGELGTPTA